MMKTAVTNENGSGYEKTKHRYREVIVCLNITAITIIQALRFIRLELRQVYVQSDSILGDYNKDTGTSYIMNNTR